MSSDSYHEQSKEYEVKSIAASDENRKIDRLASSTTTKEVDSSYFSSSNFSFDEGQYEKYQPPHSLLSYKMKWGMVFLLTMSTFWSSVGSAIYYPALKQLEKKFNADANRMNITVVVYLLFQGIAPVVSGGLADIYGRRPIIVGGMLVFIVASIGVACCNSYGVIVFLRCVQSFGISPAIAISAGVVADFTTKDERGTFVGANSGLALFGQAFGSLIGAALTSAWNWRAIFWFLAIAGGVSFVFVFTFLPETKRTIAGNLSIKPKHLINVAPVFLLKPVRQRFKWDNPDTDTLDPRKPKFDLTQALRICAQWEILLSLFPAGMQFSMWSLMLSSIASNLSSPPYNYKLIIVGVCYLPSGIGGLLGSVMTGRMIDFYYKRQLNKYNKTREQGLIPGEVPFNFFKSRLVTALPQNFICVATFLLFGWSLDKGWKIPSVLVVSCISSYCTMSTMATSTTLLVDLYPGKSSTATSCFNFIRCSLSAMFMGCFAKMQDAMTIGGVFSFLCGVTFFCNFLLLIPMKYGMRWRQERDAKARAKQIGNDNDE